MIWLTWRQHRKTVLFTAVALALLAALMIPTGLAMRNSFADLGLAECAAGTGLDPACETALDQFENRYDRLLFAGILFLVLPVLVGLFWGAPTVAREVEQGTHRLVWTQGVTRRHWAAVKFGFVGGATVLIAVVYGLGMSWWLDPLIQVNQSGFEYLLFDMQGLVPVGYTLFAVALGVFAGSVWNRMLPAMAITLLGFIGVRLAVMLLARAHYQSPLTRTSPLIGAEDLASGPGDWSLATGIRNAAGELVMTDTRIQCRPNTEGPSGGPCGSELGLDAGAYNWELYQPGDRFWLFQGIETGIFVALSLALLALAVRQVRRIA